MQLKGEDNSHLQIGKSYIFLLASTLSKQKRILHYILVTSWWAAEPVIRVDSESNKVNLPADGNFERIIPPWRELFTDWYFLKSLISFLDVQSMLVIQSPICDVCRAYVRPYETWEIST